MQTEQNFNMPGLTGFSLDIIYSMTITVVDKTFLQ